MAGDGDPVGPPEHRAGRRGVSAIAAGLDIEATHVRLKGFRVYNDLPTPLEPRTLSDDLFDVDGLGGANRAGWRDGQVGLPDAEGREGEFGGCSSVASDA